MISKAETQLMIGKKHAQILEQMVEAGLSKQPGFHDPLTAYLTRELARLSVELEILSVLCRRGSLGIVRREPNGKEEG